APLRRGRWQDGGQPSVTCCGRTSRDGLCGVRALLYSSCSAINGSTLIARRAGTDAASVAIDPSTNATATYVLASSGLTPNSKLPRYCITPAAPASPRTIPTAVSVSVCPRTRLMTCRRDAPSHHLEIAQADLDHRRPQCNSGRSPSFGHLELGPAL